MSGYRPVVICILADNNSTSTQRAFLVNITFGLQLNYTYIYNVHLLFCR